MIDRIDPTPLIYVFFFSTFVWIIPLIVLALVEIGRRYRRRRNARNNHRSQ